MAPRIGISEGPSRWDLILSLCDSETRATAEAHAVGFKADRNSISQKDRETKCGRLLFEITEWNLIGATGVVITGLRRIESIDDQWEFLGHLQSNPKIKL